ncbi:RNA recognition motif domain-containing protein, putative [Eimeria maxima]|uniref:RNA recognition motif domain-containing protein, putative n=1 Tax=Eimeria maxima TaxID=5804 RepID=U6MA83_EIMMA|nr:RNA recognition motif domain-containing protein, putative [Eimeria maxima]CDJ59409.1 RNA recognition motif domain-containing protein, putative [Eimeria maxima]
MDPHASFRFGSVLISDGDNKKDPGQLRSILVRNLPSRLSSDQSKEALRQLFSGSVMRANHLQANHREGQKSQEGILLVSAKQGILGQNRWPGRRLNPQEGRGDATQRKIVISNGHRKQLLQQLPYAVSNIRVATDDRGNSIYAVVDFTHEFLANLAIQLLGETATMPSTST